MDSLNLECHGISVWLSWRSNLESSGWVQTLTLNMNHSVGRGDLSITHFINGKLRTMKSLA